MGGTFCILDGQFESDRFDKRLAIGGRFGGAYRGADDGGPADRSFPGR